MVTTFKKSRAQNWTWSGTHFVRKTPTQKQTTAQKVSLTNSSARYYDPETGEFISQDPLEYVDGMSQYRAYFVPGSVDPTGLKLYAIAGTNAAYGDNTATQQIFDPAKDKGSFLDGTGSGGRGTWWGWLNNFNSITGYSNFSSISNLKEEICRDYCKNNDIQIDLVGWSRGAVGVLEVAQRLNDDGCCCGGELHKPVQVNWLGLFDPVNMHIGTLNDPRVPNVKHISVARKTGSDPPYWSYPDIPGADYLDAYNNDGTTTKHGQTGGASTDSNIVDWMREEAGNGGVQFK